jgi:16S rRNA (guanine(966)-N(2))-methyltransferase RsmD
VWWDLFSGTGAVGIEALSRGAAQVRFTEISAPAVGIIKANVALCGFEAAGMVQRSDSLQQLSGPPDQQFDYAYVAPPQYQGMWSETLRLLDRRPDWLREDGCAIVQIDPKEYRPVHCRNLFKFDERKYGKTLLVFYRRNR